MCEGGCHTILYNTIYTYMPILRIYFTTDSCHSLKVLIFGYPSFSNGYPKAVNILVN
jgi:hypothetical protein